MSVDFYHCDSCKESRYEEYVDYCHSCGNRVCTACVVNDDVNSDYSYEYGVKYDGSKEQHEEYGIDESYDYEIGDIIDDTGIAPKYCPFCSGDDYTDTQLLNYLLKKYGLDKKKVVEEYLTSR